MTTLADLTRAGYQVVDGKAVKIAHPRRTKADSDRYKSKLERAYVARLNALQQSGLVRQWVYEGVTFTLADGVRYTPDFLVWTSTNAVEFHEIKGVKRGRNWERSRIKLQVAARMFPQFTFLLVVGKDFDAEVIRP